MSASEVWWESPDVAIPQFPDAEDLFGGGNLESCGDPDCGCS